MSTFPASSISISSSSSGSGSRGIPLPILILAGTSTLIAVVLSASSIYVQLKNYRKPGLQRMVIRIMVMVPIYAISSFISLLSLEAAFFIDAVRDVYEAFVIYCFFVLLLTYLGGERSLLILLHGRPPKAPPFPVNLFKREIDVSDPYTFLFFKRGILQYVQIKPILAIVTMILKLLNKYNEGDLRAVSGYLYISLIYNLSICLALYSLAIFWLCVSEDLKPYRPVPKFLCVKGILFFSFWQGLAISILVAAGAIKSLGGVEDEESVSMGLTDTLICVEMPIFAVAHWFAFSVKDYMGGNGRGKGKGQGQGRQQFVGRMPVWYAFKDAFGTKDVFVDGMKTFRGEGMDYREFEPREGGMHVGLGRDRRIRAGLRYSKGGKRKYWLPRSGGASEPLLGAAGESQGEVSRAPDMRRSDEMVDVWSAVGEDVDGDGISGVRISEAGYELPFGELDEGDEGLFRESRGYLFGDYNYPCIDASTEAAKRVMWDEEERVLRDEHSAWFSPVRGSKGQEAIRARGGPAWAGYGAVGSAQRSVKKSETETDVGFVKEERVVDMEQGDSEVREGERDVRMHWTKVRKNERSRLSPGPSSPTQSTSDAVDLVVPGGPGTSSGLRRVYGVPESETEETEETEVVEAEVVLGDTDVMAGVEEHGELTRTVTPPIYARSSNTYDEHNPWAS